MPLHGGPTRFRYSQLLIDLIFVLMYERTPDPRYAQHFGATGCDDAKIGVASKGRSATIAEQILPTAEPQHPNAFVQCDDLDNTVTIS